MRTVQAIYKDGKIMFLEKNLPKRPFRVLVTFVEELTPESRKGLSREEFVNKWAGFLKGMEVNIQRANDRV